MDQATFQAGLLRDGFEPAIAGEYAPGLVNVDHTHPFEVRGLVLSGRMIVRDARGAQVCGPGDVFVMRFGETHSEEVGDAGVQYLYGSRVP
jgi:quercetin dioxygenase-like cupin family protein